MARWRAVPTRQATGAPGVRVPAALVGCLLLAACGGGAEGSGGSGGGGGTEVVELSAFPGDHILQGPIYLAQERGFFEEEGLDFGLEYPGSTVRAIQSVVGGQIGIAWTDAFGVLTAQSQGFDLISVYSTYRGSGFDFAVPEDSDITGWDAGSLRGARIGITAFDGGEVPLLRGALAAIGLTTEGEDFELVPVGEGGAETAEAIESGDVAVMAGGAHDLEALRSRGVEIRFITPDLTERFPGHVYAVTPDMLENDREAVVGFLRAHARGLIWLKENPACVAEVAMERAPETVGDLDAEGVASFVQNFWVGNNETHFDPASPDHQRFGAQDTAGWEEYQSFLIEGAIEGEDGVVITEPLDVESFVSNELIDEVNDFDQQAEAEAARAADCG
ncbi:ABC transporter substrate-binding protein [Geodermatophilus sp. SYSU D00697]